MTRYNRMVRNSGRIPLTELDEKEVEDVLISDMISDIVQNLGYTFVQNKGSSTDGTISVSDNLTIFIRYTPMEITRIYIKTEIQNNRIDCTRNTATADNLSVDLQTCVLIIKEIKNKLM